MKKTRKARKRSASCSPHARARYPFQFQMAWTGKIDFLAMFSLFVPRAADARSGAGDAPWSKDAQAHLPHICSAHTRAAQRESSAVGRLGRRRDASACQRTLSFKVRIRVKFVPIAALKLQITPCHRRRTSQSQRQHCMLA